jgi:hypothetical protein
LTGCIRLTRSIIVFLLLIMAPAARPAPLPCDPDGALPMAITAIEADGTIRIGDGLALRLANIVWPDHLEAGRRAHLVARLKAATEGQRVAWKPAAGPDRWGNVPAHLFVQEPDGRLSPFWLQAGMVEAGLVPAWPDPDNAACWQRLAAHERLAITRRRGYFAPRAQAARHRMIETNRQAHAGRPLVATWRVASVRKWRSLVFVNFAPSFRGAPSLGLTGRQVSQLGDSGQNVAAWQGKRIVARFIIGSGGLSRLRVETSRHLGPVE